MLNKELIKGDKSQEEKNVETLPEEQATSQTDLELKSEPVEPTKDQTEDNAWYDYDEDGIRIFYQTLEEGRTGLLEKEKYIQKLRNDVQNLETRYNSLEKENSELKVLTSGDVLKESKIQEKLPEQFRGKISSDFVEDPSKLDEFLKARVRAEVEIETQIREQTLKAENSRAAAENLRKRSTETVKKKVQDLLETFPNTEQRNAIYSEFTKEIKIGEEVATPLTFAIMAEEVHPDLTEIILNGILFKYRGDRRKEIAKELSKVDTKSTEDATKSEIKQTQKLHGRDAINFALSKSKKRQFKR